VAGTANSLLQTTLTQEVVTRPWYEEDWGDQVIQQVVMRKYIDNENDALLRFPTNFQGGYSIVNPEETNKWGTPRGYAIHPGYSPIHNVRTLLKDRKTSSILVTDRYRF
jgi:primary-amine oxidase